VGHPSSQKKVILLRDLSYEAYCDRRPRVTGYKTQARTAKEDPGETAPAVCSGQGPTKGEPVGDRGAMVCLRTVSSRLFWGWVEAERSEGKHVVTGLAELSHAHFLACPLGEFGRSGEA